MDDTTLMPNVAPFSFLSCLLRESLNNNEMHIVMCHKVELALFWFGNHLLEKRKKKKQNRKKRRREEDISMTPWTLAHLTTWLFSFISIFTFSEGRKCTLETCCVTHSVHL